MQTTIKALDDYDHLKAGHLYNVCSDGQGRLVVFEDIESKGHISLYVWQVKDGLLRGKLAYVDRTQSAAMSCTAVASLCGRTTTGYIY